MPRYIGAYRGGVRPSAPTTVYRTCALSLPCHSEPVTDVTGVGIRPPRLPLRGRWREAPEGEICRGSAAAYGAMWASPPTHLLKACALFSVIPRAHPKGTCFAAQSARGNPSPFHVNSGQRPPPTFAASRQRRDLIIAQTPGGCFQRGRAAALSLWSFQGEKIFKERGKSKSPFP